jgi:hypothetical protein
VRNDLFREFVELAEERSGQIGAGIFGGEGGKFGASLRIVARV